MLDRLEQWHEEILRRRVDTIQADDPKIVKPIDRAKSSCRLLQQTLLHRAERLLFSSGTLLIDSNICGLGLFVRGHFETMAVLGFFCNRLESLEVGHIKFEDFEWTIVDAIIGTKHEHFRNARKPIHINACIEKTDKYLNKHVFKERKDIVQDCYNWLSEFAHPNFPANFSTFDLNKENNCYILRHGNAIRKEDFQLFGYIDISCDLFVTLFDHFQVRTR